MAAQIIHNPLLIMSSYPSSSTATATTTTPTPAASEPVNTDRHTLQALLLDLEETRQRPTPHARLLPVVTSRHGRKRQRPSVHLAYYQKLESDCQKDLARQQAHAQSMADKVARVRAVYLYGLSTVASLTGLQAAPDAILPGNFDSSTTSKQSKTVPANETAREEADGSIATKE